MMQDELGSGIIRTFTRLRSKKYSYIYMKDNDKENKKAKGMKMYYKMW